MKKIIFNIAVVVLALITLTITISAEENINITQYYSTGEKITVYTSGKLSEQVTARIAGISCEAENMGDIYHNSEKFETIFLIDSSKSMQNFSDEINTFLVECIDKKRDNEYYSIGVFASGNFPEYIITCENNQYALEKIIDKIGYEYGSTYIYDNLVNAIENLYSDDQAIYRRIVLITDGNENSATGITIDDVIEKISENPVPIYTVTLQRSDKKNIENLKNIARLARKSSAEDIRISDGGDAVKSVDILINSVQNVDCINIIPDTSLLDGLVKAIEIADSSVTVSSDIRLAMADTIHTDTETVQQITIEETTSAAEVEASNKSADMEIKPLIAIIAAVVAIICIVIIIIFIIKGKKKVIEHDEALPLANNDDTMIIGGRSGQTEILIEDDVSEKKRSVILRDIADSMRMFEVQLTSSGMIIGRSSDFSNIVIDYDKSVSRKHCRIFLKNGQVYIEDLSSGNKTYLNNVEISSPTVINNSDEIKIGRTRLKVTIK